MQHILQEINKLGFSPIVQSNITVEAKSKVNLSAINPEHFSLRVGAGAQANIILLHGDSSPLSMAIRLESGAHLTLTQLLVGNSPVTLDVNQGEGSTSRIVAISLSSNSASYNVQLLGRESHGELHTLQMATEKDHSRLKINMRHMSPDSSSHSLSKCIASGESHVEFEGLVYVAHDAQRTAASQNCRSIELSDNSHIVSQPQLEIYADDVKCSHGATMGQMDSDAIFYMRQRGLSEAQARRVQIEGFVADVVGKCYTPDICESLQNIVSHKLEQM